MGALRFTIKLGGHFGYFLFFLLGEGEGGVRGARKGGGDRFSIENPRRGGVSQRGREGVCSESGNFEAGGGGGAKYFLSGPKRPPSKVVGKNT